MTKGELINALLRASDIPDEAEVVLNTFCDMVNDDGTPCQTMQVLALKAGTAEELGELCSLPGLPEELREAQPMELGEVRLPPGIIRAPPRMDELMAVTRLIELLRGGVDAVEMVTRLTYGRGLTEDEKRTCVEAQKLIVRGAEGTDGSDIG